ncbi:MAG: ribose-phosphate diphosphokinase [Pseudomonadota bacterium]|nr:ribose-phosphate diphosphokinase [Pseudomonadota bacterium]
MIHIIAGSASHQLGNLVADQLGLPVTLSQRAYFPDGEMDVSIDTDLSQQTAYIIQSLAQEPNAHLIELFLLADCARRNGAQSVVAVIPYLAYMRQDKPEHHHAYASPAIARLLSQMVDKVILVEPHVPQVGGFFSVPVREVFTAGLFQQDILSRGLEDSVLVSPDLGGVKRVEMVKPSAATKIAIIEKTRDEEGIHVQSLLGDVSGKNCILIDDVIASGGTIVQAANLLKQHGAENVYVYATHATIPSRLDEIIAQPAIDEVIVTDSIAGVEKKYAKLSVSSEISSSIELTNGDRDENQSRDQRE